MIEGKYFSFIGASGSGKSTLLNFIKENYSNIEVKEVSARNFLDSNKGSYDNQMNDELEAKIDYYYLQETFRNILKAKDGYNIVTSRCIIDSLAYTCSLKAAEFLIPQIKEAIKIVKDNIIFLYTPCDFALSQKEDTLRGMNETIRQETDKKYREIIKEFNIDYYLINGSLEKRKNIINEIMIKNKILF